MHGLDVRGAQDEVHASESTCGAEALDDSSAGDDDFAGMPAISFSIADEPWSGAQYDSLRAECQQSALDSYGLTIDVTAWNVRSGVDH